jgi:5'-nucleotidase
VIAFAIDATPATCAQVGLSGALGFAAIDLVVSGINAGPNIGGDVFYSGTVGAAITARLMGYPAIATSLEIGKKGREHWETAAAWLAEVVQEYGDLLRSSPTLLNLNVPHRALSDVAGIEITTLSTYTCANAYRVQVEGGARLCLKRFYAAGDQHRQPGSDAWALSQGYVSLTPLEILGDMIGVMPWARSERPEPAPVPTNGVELMTTQPLAAEISVSTQGQATLRQ